jgi:hypothetical protein
VMTAPPLRGAEQAEMAISDVASGALLIVFATIALSWRAGWARWGAAAIGFWLLFAPLLFWTPDAAIYLNDTLVGILVIAFAVALPPEPGVSPVAATTGPDIPPGWSYNPSAWTQRLPIIALALVGLYVSRYLAGSQLEHLDGVWEPFFAGSLEDPQNGTEEIITSWAAEAWPISDGGLGAITYLLEILTGIIGLRARWRTMPWLVVIFGLLIVPLSVTSISFIIIQPILLGTWSTLARIIHRGWAGLRKAARRSVVFGGVGDAADQGLRLRRGVGSGASRPVVYGGSLAIRPARLAKPVW